jgi:hypothetical protein
MTIGCTRCGATQEGEIILPQIAFRFPHKKGCGHGIGPLAKVPTSKKKQVDKPAKESKPKVEKVKVFAQNESTTTTHSTSTVTATNDKKSNVQEL